ncbi:MAG TPA: hypothetical protein VEI95_03495 [Acidobacteriota bacterium]|nr:hypothetical protein [Acidobacteriota bacterium]
MTKQRPTLATLTSPGSSISFPILFNISGYIADFAPLKRRTLPKAEEHTARQFIEYEKQDVNPETSARADADSIDSRQSHRLWRQWLSNQRLNH